MSRRRIRMICSSDEEEEPPPRMEQTMEFPGDEFIDDIEEELQTVTLNSSTITPISNMSTTSTHYPSSVPIPLDISDEEPNTTNSSNTANNGSNISNSSSNNYFVVSDSLVNEVLEGLGLRLRREWLDSCLGALGTSVQGFAGLHDSVKAKLCFEQFLHSDMNYCGAGVLPPDVHTLHLVDLKGPFVLQVDEIVNISTPLRGRYQSAASGVKRSLKLSMTDGVQRVFGMEYRPIKELEVLAPAGLKVAICNVNVRHGLLMLVPEVISVLGGMVEELEAARQRLVNEVNKPPRGKRIQTGVVPPLATRETSAAWAPPSANGPGPTTDSTMPSQATPQGFTSGVSANHNQRQHFTFSASRNNAETSSGTALRTPASSRPTQSFAVPASRNCFEPGISATDNQRTDFAVSTSRNNAETSSSFTGTAFRTPASGRPTQSSAVPVSRNIGEPGISVTDSQIKDIPVSESRNNSGTSSSSAETAFGKSTQRFAVPESRNIVEPRILSSAQPSDHAVPMESLNHETVPGIPANDINREDFTSPITTGDVNRNLSSSVAMDVEEISSAEEFDHPWILSGDKEIPFTYMASLTAKWAALEDKTSPVRGKIKCIVSGVKAFQYKEGPTYELRVYIDDGSLIYEILIDHSVVQSVIGHSPENVRRALNSKDSERVTDMRNKFRLFEKFLMNFEGMMLVEINEASPVPVAIEMNEGFPELDPWLLLKRLKPSNSAQPRDNSSVDLIVLSPE